MKIVILLSALFLLIACRAETPAERRFSANDVVPLDLCQPRFSQDGSFCALDRCDVPMPCATEDDLDCDGVRDYGATFDNCIYFCNPEQENADGDYMGDACDPCPNSPGNDFDKDGVCGDVDNCPGEANDDQANTDGDSFGNACDQTPNGDPHVATIAELETRLEALETAQAQINSALLME
jgi:hypothetical protein